jgi:predicted transcriptional regulator
MNPFKKIAEIFNNKEIILRYKHGKPVWKKTPYIYYRKPGENFIIQFEFDGRIFEILKKYELLEQIGGNWEEHSTTYLLDFNKLKKLFISIRDKKKGNRL